jgi:hypothetical protein
LLGAAAHCAKALRDAEALWVNAVHDLIRWRDEHRLLPLLLIASVVILLAVAVAAIWSRGSLANNMRFASLQVMQGAYDRVQPGRTSQTQLTVLGFDTARFRARSLSGLGVQEYFMPRTSRDFDKLDPAVRYCFDNPDRCNALVFPLAASSAEEGMFAAHAAPRESGRIVFLIKSGRVAYKAVSGT